MGAAREPGSTSRPASALAIQRERPKQSSYVSRRGRPLIFVHISRPFCAGRVCSRGNEQLGRVCTASLRLLLCPPWKPFPARCNVHVHVHARVLGPVVHAFQPVSADRYSLYQLPRTPFSRLTRNCSRPNEVRVLSFAARNYHRLVSRYFILRSQVHRCMYVFRCHCFRIRERITEKQNQQFGICNRWNFNTGTIDDEKKFPSEMYRSKDASWKDFTIRLYVSRDNI